MNEPAAATETREARRRQRWRRALPWWAQVAILLTVFTAGGAVGAMLATKSIHSNMDYYREHADALPRDIVPRLQHRLGMTPEQTEEVRKIIERRHPRMIESRGLGAQAMLSEFDAMRREISEVLDEHQKGRWSAIAQSVRTRYLPPEPGR